MPSLLETQQLLGQSLVHGGDDEAALLIRDNGINPAELLDIYRGTYRGTMVGALRLTYPALQKLVGEEFFEGAARLYIEQSPPDSAYLDDYGATFDAFLAQLPAAAALTYLPDVAKLEWAVSRALHAMDMPALDVHRLAALGEDECARARFIACPSVSLLQTAAPADAIWRAVLDDNDAALQLIDFSQKPRFLMVQRREAGLEVLSMDEDAWHLASLLFEGRPLADAIALSGTTRADVLLAGHLSAGRIVDFTLAESFAA